MRSRTGSQTFRSKRLLLARYNLLVDDRAMSRWHRARRAYENEQTYENEPTKAQVIGPAPVDPDWREQLKHARGQLKLQSEYPGRPKGS
jgi:hypothetical protein